MLPTCCACGGRGEGERLSGEPLFRIHTPARERVLRTWKSCSRIYGERRATCRRRTEARWETIDEALDGVTIRSSSGTTDKGVHDEEVAHEK
jgi:hypothetical protein